MAHKIILVPLDGGPSGEAVLAVAHGIAGRNNAHLEIFHAQPDSKEAVPLLGEGMSGAMIEEMMELADRDAESRTQVAHRHYQEFRDAHGLAEAANGPSDEISVNWSTETGREDELVARHGRLADLIVIGRPDRDVERPSLMTLHAAIFETGKPVLVVPPNPRTTAPTNVAIAWNGSAEASRAVAGAMPALQKAAKVTITTVETEKSAGRISASELVRYLSWHGVSSEQQTVSPAGHSVGRALLLQAGKDGVDLLVMGAYTHSRVIQIILGGVTRHVLSEAELPVLMSH
ncbi:MAG: universal stress protein [Rhodospirillales bacterium]|nr:universal stress protein [Rhodospirillales bacterium]